MDRPREDYRHLDSSPSASAGKYAVKIRYAARPTPGKTANYRASPSAPTSSNPPSSPPAIAYQYQTFDVGAITFPKAGQYKLQLKPAQSYSHDLMYLESLSLEPLQ
jgi:hypothetical protein